MSVAIKLRLGECNQRVLFPTNVFDLLRSGHECNLPGGCVVWRRLIGSQDVNNPGQRDGGIGSE